MSLWQFQSAVNGWMRANGAESKPPPPDENEHQALLEKYA